VCTLYRCGHLRQERRTLRGRNARKVHISVGIRSGAAIRSSDRTQWQGDGPKAKPVRSPRLALPCVFPTAGPGSAFMCHGHFYRYARGREHGAHRLRPRDNGRRPRCSRLLPAAQWRSTRGQSTADRRRSTPHVRRALHTPSNTLSGEPHRGAIAALPLCFASNGVAEIPSLVPKLTATSSVPSWHAFPYSRYCPLTAVLGCDSLLRTQRGRDYPKELRDNEAASPRGAAVQ